MNETIAIKRADGDEPMRASSCAKCRAEVVISPGVLNMYIVPRWKPVCGPYAAEVKPEMADLYAMFYAAHGFAHNLGEDPLEVLKTRAMAFRRESTADRTARFLNGEQVLGDNGGFDEEERELIAGDGEWPDTIGG